MKVKLCFYNEHFNVFFNAPKMQESWKKIAEERKRIIDDEKGYEGTLRLSKYIVNDLEVYTFGILFDEMRARPGHKGEWSSNEEYIKQMFGDDLVPVGVGGISASIKREDVFNFVNKDKFYFRGPWLQSDIIMGEPFQWYDGNGNEVSEDYE